MTKNQAMEKIIRALVAFGMDATQMNNSSIVVDLANANMETVTITIGPVKK